MLGRSHGIFEIFENWSFDDRIRLLKRTVFGKVQGADWLAISLSNSLDDNDDILVR
jgi:hypothetical protein